MFLPPILLLWRYVLPILHKKVRFLKHLKGIFGKAIRQENFFHPFWLFTVAQLNNFIQYWSSKWPFLGRIMGTGVYFFFMYLHQQRLLICCIWQWAHLQTEHIWKKVMNLISFAIELLLFLPTHTHASILFTVYITIWRYKVQTTK